VKVFRISKNEFIHDLSGMGAELYGGRWNKKGVGLIYTSESIALATVEFLVHVHVASVPGNLRIAAIQIPANIKPICIAAKDLPSNWQNYPAPPKLAEIGTTWALSKKSLLLKVPSAIVIYESNILINPLHPDMKHVKIVKIENYQIDRRLL
jgi:RES domain-containing protein